jgi:hypothetical protein
LGEVGVVAQDGGDAAQLVGAALLQTLDDGGNDVAPALLLDVLEARLEAGDILLGLLDAGELVGERFAARVWLERGGVELGGAGGDEGGIDAVILGAAQVQPGEGFDLQRLQEENGEALGLEQAGGAAFIAAGGLDADAADAGLGEFGGEDLPAGRAVVDAKGDVAAVDGDIELVLGGIDTCGECGNV